jgi:hypothetical protein
VKYRPDLNDELRDRHGRSGKIVNVEFEKAGTVYVVEWDKRWAKVTEKLSPGELNKARRRYLRAVRQ